MENVPKILFIEKFLGYLNMTRIDYIFDHLGSPGTIGNITWNQGKCELLTDNTKKKTVTE